MALVDQNRLDLLVIRYRFFAIELEFTDRLNGRGWLVIGRNESWKYRKEKEGRKITHYAFSHSQSLHHVDVDFGFMYQGRVAVNHADGLDNEILPVAGRGIGRSPKDQFDLILARGNGDLVRVDSFTV